MRPAQDEPAPGPRTEILDCIRRYPGVHLREIERRTDLPLGQVLHHIGRLERLGLVASARDRGFRRFYDADTIGRHEKRYLAALRHDVPRHIVLLLLDHGKPLSHRGLQDRLDVAGSTLSFHLQRLVESGLLQREQVGASHLYALTDPALAEREIVYHRGSFEDPAVDAHVRRLLERIAPGSRDVPAP